MNKALINNVIFFVIYIAVIIKTLMLTLDKSSSPDICFIMWTLVWLYGYIGNSEWEKLNKN
jgi:hypothetical protein